MTMTIVLSALCGGTVVSYPLLKWWHQISGETLNKVERLCGWVSPLLLAGVSQLLPTLYPVGHAILLGAVAVLGALTIAIMVGKALDESIPWARAVPPCFTAIIIAGLLASEGLLVNAASGRFPSGEPSLCVWIGGKRAVPALIAELKDVDILRRESNGWSSGWPYRTCLQLKEYSFLL